MAVVQDNFQTDEGQHCLNWSHNLCLTIFDNMTFLGKFCVNQYPDKPQSINNFSIQHTHFEWKQCWICILYNNLYKTAAYFILPITNNSLPKSNHSAFNKKYLFDNGLIHHKKYNLVYFFFQT